MRIRVERHVQFSYCAIKKKKKSAERDNMFDRPSASLGVYVFRREQL